MEKVVIIGSSGAGKSTLARNLGLILKMKVFHLDRIFWKRDWVEKNGYERMELLEGFLLREKRWIIEGNYLRFAELHVKAADTIIFLDLPLHLCLWRIIKRHYEHRGFPRRDIPEGCTDRFTWQHMFKVLIFQFQGRRIIEQTLDNNLSKKIIRLHSTKEVEDFLAEQEQIANEKNISSSASTVRESLLATRQ